MKLIHYSEIPLAGIYSVNQFETAELDVRYNLLKPQGIFISVEGEYDWLWWVKENDFAINRWKYATQIILKNNNNVLLIDTDEKFVQFSEKYKIKLGGFMHVIQWHEVAKYYGRVIISPYFWNFRLSEHRWYYGWDCASGVIWDANCVDSLLQLEVPGLITI